MFLGPSLEILLICILWLNSHEHIFLIWLLFPKSTLLFLDKYLTKCLYQICEGGLMITDTGHVLGMNFYGAGHSAHLLPMHVIQSCLAMWRSLGYGALLLFEYKKYCYGVWYKSLSNVYVSHFTCYLLSSYWSC